MEYAFPPPSIPSVAVADSAARFPVHRIYCVGRNYADHAREMGANPEREEPFFFAKPADAVVADGAAVPYPPATGNFHHEVELVVAIGRAGANIEPSAALEGVYGYAVGIDLTRRDLQLAARDKGRPWDAGKGFDDSAPLSAIRRVSEIGHPARGAISLAVNGQTKQRADLSDLIWSVPEVIAHLSKLFALKAGDLIFTGTPAGVGPLVSGDRVQAAIDGVGSLSVHIAS